MLRFVLEDSERAKAERDGIRDLARKVLATCDAIEALPAQERGTGSYKDELSGDAVGLLNELDLTTAKLGHVARGGGTW